MVSGIASLRTLSAIINEPNGLLTDQILGAFGPKLRELELSGNPEIFAFGNLWFGHSNIFGEPEIIQHCKLIKKKQVIFQFFQNGTFEPVREIQ